LTRWSSLQNFDKNKQFGPNYYLEYGMKFLHIIPKLAIALLQLVSDLIVLYFLFALIGCFWGRHKNEIVHTTGIPLQIQSDGFHTELYLPVQDSMGLINWMDWFDDSSISKNQQHKQLISFAFAEYDWTLAGIDQEPKGIGTTFEILFSPWNKSLMHVQ
jgi:hypothetical protein